MWVPHQAHQARMWTWMKTPEKFVRRLAWQAGPQDHSGKVPALRKVDWPREGTLVQNAGVRKGCGCKARGWKQLSCRTCWFSTECLQLGWECARAPRSLSVPQVTTGSAKQQSGAEKKKKSLPVSQRSFPQSIKSLPPCRGGQLVEEMRHQFLSLFFLKTCEDRNEKDNFTEHLS